jgi:hypothetical protein
LSPTAIPTGKDVEAVIIDLLERPEPKDDDE